MNLLKIAIVVIILIVSQLACGNRWCDGDLTGQPAAVQKAAAIECGR
jgi:hypothetical protein